VRLQRAAGRLIGDVRIFLQPHLFAVLLLLTIAVCPAPAAAQQPAPAAPESLHRIKDDLATGPAITLTTQTPVQLRPTFKARADERVFVPTLEEVLHKQFDLNDIQRQSARWAAQCCGFKVGQVIDVIDDALRDRKIRNTREQIQRELGEIEANIRKQLADAKAAAEAK
jgi:hypothetical protein